MCEYIALLITLVINQIYECHVSRNSPTNSIFPSAWWELCLFIIMYVVFLVALEPVQTKSLAVLITIQLTRNHFKGSYL